MLQFPNPNTSVAPFTAQHLEDDRAIWECTQTADPVVRADHEIQMFQMLLSQRSYGGLLGAVARLLQSPTPAGSGGPS